MDKRRGLKWVEVDLRAISANTRWVLSRLGGADRLTAAVKADAYGHGAARTARAALAAGAHALGVRDLAEAAELRRAGLRAAIQLLMPILPAQAAEAVRLNAGATIDDAAQARALNAAARGKTVEVWIEVDFGLGRWGAPPALASQLLAAVARLPRLRAAGISAHIGYVPGKNSVEAEEKLGALRRLSAPHKKKNPAFRVRAANSVAAYARDVTVFCRFLHESRGAKTIWACDEADLRAYKQLRLRGPQHMRVSVATWRRFIAAIDKWAAWSLSEGLIQREPFSYREKSVWTPVGARRVHINTASEPQPGPAPIRFVSYPDYLIWRDVGLRGRLLDGRADPCFHGRHAARDSAFADMVVSTGMRLGEAASLLVPELPPAQAEGAGRLRGIHLAGAVTKRGRPRTVFAPARVLRALGRYVAIERSALVTAGTAGDGYRLTTQAILVRRTGTAAVMLPDSSSRSYSKLDPTLRSRLVLVDDDGQVNGPLALWLGEHGRPVSPASWQSVFRRANLRCAEAGLELKCSPHTLRHVFAVHMLGLLLRQSVAALGADPSRRLASTQLRALLVGNPLRKLQLLLGHANEATVYAYLDVLDEAEEIVAAALENWDSESGALDSAPTGDQAILAAQA